MTEAHAGRKNVGARLRGEGRQLSAGPAAAMVAAHESELSLAPSCRPVGDGGEHTPDGSAGAERVGRTAKSCISTATLTRSRGTAHRAGAMDRLRRTAFACGGPASRSSRRRAAGRTGAKAGVPDGIAYVGPGWGIAARGVKAQAYTTRATARVALHSREAAQPYFRYAQRAARSWSKN